MNKPETMIEYFASLPRSTRIAVGVMALPAFSLLAIMSLRTLAFSNSKPFQDPAGLLIVYMLAMVGPILCIVAPRRRFLHWLPVIIIGCGQFAIVALAKPMSEWWLYLVVAPFSVGVPALTLIAYKRWYAPRFGL